MSARNDRDARSRTSQKPPAKPKKEELDPEEELDEDDEEEELDDEETQDDEDEEDEPELDGFTLKSAVAEVKRLRTELHGVKKENVSLRRKKEPQKPLPDQEDDDKETQLREAQTFAAKMQKHVLDSQKREAVRAYLDEHKLSHYAPSVNYMVNDLDLGPEDVDDDKGLYDTALLTDSVDKSVRAFIKANPRKKVADDDEEAEEEKTVPRSRRGVGVGASPARKVARNGANSKRAKLDEHYQGLLSSTLFK